jgi:hypothetical protein
LLLFFPHQRSCLFGQNSNGSSVAYHKFIRFIPVGGLEHTFSFSVRNVIIPTDELHFSEG